MKRIKVGTQFRHTYADSNALWTVIESRGKGTWIAEIDGSNSDYAGERAAFTTEDIQSSIKMAEFWKQSSDDSEKFYLNLVPGSIVHYHNGFNCYVRCQVMPDKQLLPIALVGEWREYDLPYRCEDGSICLGYHAEQIKFGKTFQPHASNIWEYRGARQTGDIDPTSLVPRCLEVPPLTVEEEAVAKLWVKVNQIKEAINNSNRDPQLILKDVERVLNP